MTHTDATTETSQRSSSLFADVRDGLTKKALDPAIRLIRDEISSARAEIRDRVAGAKVGLILTAIGAVLALASVGLVAALAVALLELVLQPWAAIAIALGVFLLLAGLAIGLGIRGIKRGIPPVPKDTIADARSRVAGA